MRITKNVRQLKKEKKKSVKTVHKSVKLGKERKDTKMFILNVEKNSHKLS